MPQPQSPPPSPRPAPVLCQRCGSPMQLATLEPHYRYINLDRVDYICDCGFSTYSLLARDE